MAKTPMSIRVDEVTKALLKATSEELNSQQSAVIEKSISAFAHDVLGRQEWEKIINKYYDDPLGLWSASHRVARGVEHSAPVNDKSD